MKKLLLTCASVFFLTACSERQTYEDAVLEEMKVEQDLKDYKIDPVHMTECVVDLSIKKMPGLFPLDPVRLTAYKNYATMLGMSSAENKEAKLDELRALFGSPKELIKARSNYTESLMNCLAAIIMESEEAAEAERGEAAVSE